MKLTRRDIKGLTKAYENKTIEYLPFTIKNGENIEGRERQAIVVHVSRKINSFSFELNNGQILDFSYQDNTDPKGLLDTEESLFAKGTQDYYNGSIDHYLVKIKETKKPINKYAICTKSVGREDEAKYKRCKDDISGTALNTGIGNPVTLEQVNNIVNTFESKGGATVEGAFQDTVTEYGTKINIVVVTDILNMYNQGKDAETIWMQIELDEALVKLPGMKIKDILGDIYTIVSLEKDKVNRKVILHTKGEKFAKGRYILSLEGVIELWTTRKTIGGDMLIRSDIGNPVTLEQVKEIIDKYNEHYNRIKGFSARKLATGHTIDDFSDLPTELVKSIIDGYENSENAEEIWENIELEEAIKKLPGREVRVRDGFMEKIDRVEKASKLTPLYKIFFGGNEGQTITAKELVRLWTTGESTDFLLIKEEKSSYQKMIESPTMKKLQEELMEEVQWKVGDTVTDGKGFIGIIMSFNEAEQAIVKPISINGEKVDEKKHSSFRTYNTYDLEKLDTKNPIQIIKGRSTGAFHITDYKGFQRDVFINPGRDEAWQFKINQRKPFKEIGSSKSERFVSKEDAIEAANKWIDTYLENQDTPAEMIKKSLGWENKKIGNNLYLKVEDNKFSRLFSEINKRIRNSEDLGVDSLAFDELMDASARVYVGSGKTSIKKELINLIGIIRILNSKK